MYKVNATFKVFVPVNLVLEGTLNGIREDDSFSDLSYDLLNAAPVLVSTDLKLDTLDLSDLLSDDPEFIRVNSLTYVEATPEPVVTPSVSDSSTWQTAVVQPLPEVPGFTNIPEALRYVRA